MVGLGFGRLIGIVVSAVIFASQPSHAGEVLDAMTTPGIGPKPEEITWPPFPEGKRPMEWLYGDWGPVDEVKGYGALHMKIRPDGWITFDGKRAAMQYRLILETNYFCLLMIKKWVGDDDPIEEASYALLQLSPRHIKGGESYNGDMFGFVYRLLGPFLMENGEGAIGVRKKFSALFDGSQRDLIEFWKGYPMAPMNMAKDMPTRWDWKPHSSQTWFRIGSGEFPPPELVGGEPTKEPPANHMR